MNPDRLLSITKAAAYLGVHQNTLRKWADAGHIPPTMTVGGHRRFRVSDLDALQGKVPEAPTKTRVAVYCRVSSHDQKKSGDLDRQKGRVLQHCVEEGYNVKHVLEDVGSGMSSNRVRLRKLSKLAVQGKIDRVVVENKDRLARFYFDVFVTFFESHGVAVEWTQETLNGSFAE